MSEEQDKILSEVPLEDLITYATLRMSSAINKTCTEKGFWEEGTFRNKSEMICLMHDELCEAHEVVRDLVGSADRGPRSEKIDSEHLTEEMADCVIRIADFCFGFGLDLGDAIAKKMAHNEGRSYKHGRQL